VRRNANEMDARFSLIGPALLRPRDLHQSLPIFTLKNQFDTQRRGASNSKNTAHDACRLNRGFVDSEWAEGGKIDGCLHGRFEWPEVLERSFAAQTRRTFSSSLAYRKR
jgi:hypothetical protein